MLVVVLFVGPSFLISRENPKEIQSTRPHGGSKVAKNVGVSARVKNGIHPLAEGIGFHDPKV